MSEFINRDLKPFGVTYDALDARELTSFDLDLYDIGAGTQVYKIPYFDIDGAPVNHARLRLVDPNEDSGGAFIRVDKDSTRIYFPPTFADEDPKTIHITEQGFRATHAPIFFVDDERMVARITNIHKFKAIGIEGVAGWSTSLGLADGFGKLVDYIIGEKLTVMLWFGNGKDVNVQREVANLAMELKFRGVPFANIRQYIAQDLNDEDLFSCLRDTSRFPKHPQIRNYLTDKIELTPKLNRKDHQQLALAILADMESKGFRIRSTTTGDYYYFNRETKELVSASLAYNGHELMQNSDFIAEIYRNYGLSPQDRPILGWLSTQFMAEEPIARTKSYRVMLCDPRKENTFAIQLDNAHFVHYDREANDTSRAIIRENGDGGILFEKDAVRPLDISKFREELETQRARYKGKHIPFWWGDVVNELRLDREQRFKTFLALLYYVAPWLKGWRNIQLPIEVVTGEAGTGKSSIFFIRNGIMTGVMKAPKLPADMREWSAKVVSTNGLLLFDNVHMANRVTTQMISDEICRLITEPEPTIEMRQLYKTAEIAEFPVQCTFAITSIKNVFTNIDFIQRAVIIHLERPYSAGVEDLSFTGWVEEQLEKHGGREAWLAHHVLVMERFFQYADELWDDKYRSKIRLINFEQTVRIMGQVFGIETDWLPDILNMNAKKSAVSVDWILEGLSRFTDYRREIGQLTFSAQDVANWAEANDEFNSQVVLINSRKIGRYIEEHRTIVRMVTGIMVERRPKGNIYTIEPGVATVTNPDDETVKKYQAKYEKESADDEGEIRQTIKRREIQAQNRRRRETKP